MSEKTLLERLREYDWYSCVYLQKHNVVSCERTSVSDALFGCGDFAIPVSKYVRDPHNVLKQSISTTSEVVIAGPPYIIY